MRRRTFLSTVAATTLGSQSTRATSTSTQFELQTSDSDQIPALVCESTASLLDASYDALTDDDVVAVWAEDTATNVDDDGSGDAVYYDDDTAIPVVATDDDVIGFGSMLVTDDTNWQRGNEEFVLNVWDAHIGGTGAVLWGEGHGQYYDLAEFSEFEAYAEDTGYTVTATETLTDDLDSADAAVITSPSESFTSSEIDDLNSFVTNGGVVLLHDQSDNGDNDETSVLNDIAEALSLAFRFNDDAVFDEIQHAGEDYKPLTEVYNTAFEYFTDRDGLGLDPTATYTVDVTSVADGDTVDVMFDDGREENIRILGIDTPEKEQYERYERIQEWEGIADLDALQYWADEATTFAQDELADQTVELSFDENEPVRDYYDRVLGYLHYDRNGDGSRDSLYNYQAVEQGYARVYDSSMTKHRRFWEGEADARETDRRLWSDSDMSASTEKRDSPVDDLFFPETASVRTATGAVDSSRVPVFAESTATQDLDGGVSYDDIPLVAIDESLNLALAGGAFIDESYESGEGYDVETWMYDNYVFLTNLVDLLAGRDGEVLVDGGHGQFGTTYGLSAEDAAWYMRYLEGQGLGFEQVNVISESALSAGRALVICTPPETFTSDEIDALQSFIDDGGAVILLGSGKTTADARSNLNTLASDLGTDLRCNEDQVLDTTNQVGSDDEVPVTTEFETGTYFSLFQRYTADSSPLAIAEIHEDGDTLNDEYVVFENTGESAVELTGYSVFDEAHSKYVFPDGFTLAAGAQVTLHTGDGDDTETDLYWGSGQYIWNDTGDTAWLYDADRNLAAKESYPSAENSGEFTIAEIHEDAEGDDYDNLNDEYVVFENTGANAIDLEGWTVEDEAGHTYGFPDGFTLDAGASVTLHSGEGDDTETDLYWGSSQPVWNNDSDTCFVYDGAGGLVAKESY